MDRKRRCFALCYAVALAVFLVTGGLLLRSRLQAEEASHVYHILSRQGGKTAAERALPLAEPACKGGEPLPERSVRVAELREQYPDVTAWLRAEGTPVDYPVVQGRDNRKYLDTLTDGTRNPAGSIFLDCRCALDGQHLILYGHNMRNGSMFGSLRRYLEADYLREHPEFSLFTSEGELRCRIFSVRRVDAYDTDAYLLEPPEGTAMDEFVRQMAEQSALPLPEESCERVVTLSTCTGVFPTQRLVVQAGILPPEAAS